MLIKRERVCSVPVFGNPSHALDGALSLADWPSRSFEWARAFWVGGDGREVKRQCSADYKIKSRSGSVTDQ
jgi:hypothetical protein